MQKVLLTDCRYGFFLERPSSGSELKNLNRNFKNGNCFYGLLLIPTLYVFLTIYSILGGTATYQASTEERQTALIVQRQNTFKARV